MVPTFLMVECHLPFLGRGNLEEEQVWGKVKPSVCASYGSLRRPSADVKKAFGYMSLEIKGGSWRYTCESCQY